MTFPPPPAPVASGLDNRQLAEKPPRAGLAVLAVALAVLLGGVGLVWYINEHDADNGGSPAQLIVPYSHAPP